MTGRQRRLPEGLLFGIGVCAALLWMFLFATPGVVEVATFLATLTMLVWFGTVEPARLVDEQSRPQWRLFLLAGVGLAVLTSAIRVLGSGTMLLTLAVGFSALVVGGVRAVRTQTHPGR